MQRRRTREKAERSIEQLLQARDTAHGKERCAKENPVLRRERGRSERACAVARIYAGRVRGKSGGEVRQGEICAAGRPMRWDLRALRRNAGGGLANQQRVRRKERKRHIGGNAVRCARKTGARAKYAVKVNAPEYGEVAGVLSAGHVRRQIEIRRQTIICRRQNAKCAAPPK